MYIKINMILQKEVSRLQGLVGSDKTEGLGSQGFVCESPSMFKWDQGHATFSPLNFDKRTTQVFITVFACRT
jgi:kinesin family protein 15